MQPFFWLLHFLIRCLLKIYELMLSEIMGSCEKGSCCLVMSGQVRSVSRALEAWALTWGCLVPTTPMSAGGLLVSRPPGVWGAQSGALTTRLPTTYARAHSRFASWLSVTNPTQPRHSQRTPWGLTSLLHTYSLHFSLFRCHTVHSYFSS